ncbi:hypothetical protein M413DRAFT_447245 [Hebeloma cylindrosporum]|uniref:Protein kinase domain-containing protein n=1 Tax=Hebeloma cylindrosporum TaxID=76867 RepID=A0A0C3C4W0_HEBCY|nr:hypothetical protein M413DRAFT_447245 [Hebeloma cylindrosporum h7]
MNNPLIPEDRGEHEMFWVSLQPHLLSRGYKLRPRYDPEWTPSWTKPGGKHRGFYEDSLRGGAKLLDGIRISDNMKVVFKPVATSSDELALAILLSSPKARADTRNCAVPVLDVVDIPGNDERVLMVMPMLKEIFNVPFRRVGEVVEMLEQFLYCLQFLHENNIVHMDFCRYNLMMDGSRIIPKGWHFCNAYSHDGVSFASAFEWNDRWSVRPVQYYLIDFGLSRQLQDASTRVVGDWGQDRTVPEMSFEIPSDPFKVDVYQLGNAIKEYVAAYTGLRILDPLIENMTASDPVKRFTADQAVLYFQERKAKWSKRAMKSRIWKKGTPFKRRFMVKYRGENPITV